ncbi:MAG: hypothetical protein GXO79_14240 [Chlorobi bacterium]|nr:hypothetical protein [Chlorobiota bacterium]
MIKIEYTVLLLISFSILANESNGAVIKTKENSKNQTLSKKDTVQYANYTDGPYVKWNRKRKIKALYFYTNGKNERVKKVKKNFRANTDTFNMYGFYNDTNVYRLHYHNKIEKSDFQGVEKIFVMGDVHGAYLPMIKLLKYNKVIDNNLNWTFGKGHLVFTGDIFDKGNYVTECLWFIYILEQKAERAGGKVHLVLGTHEFLELNNFNGYLTDKYNFLFTKKYRYYSDYYSKKYILGKWLRTKNMVLIINENLFVHGGISPEFFNLNLNVEESNILARKYLDNPFKYKKEKDIKVIIGRSGPFWYRGFNKGEKGYNDISEVFLNKVLNFYNVERIIFGHTEKQKIEPTFSGKLINIDVPLGIEGVECEALLINEQGFFRVYSNKSPEGILN